MYISLTLLACLLAAPAPLHDPDLLEYAGLVDLEDLDFLPRSPGAFGLEGDGGCPRGQIPALERHLAWLRLQRSVNGPICWDAWIEETEFRLRYWQLLERAHLPAWQFDLPRDWPLRQLRELYRHIGPERYSQGWSPDLLPPGLHLPPPKMPSAADNNR